MSGAPKCSVCWQANASRNPEHGRKSGINYTYGNPPPEPPKYQKVCQKCHRFAEWLISMTTEPTPRDRRARMAAQRKRKGQKKPSASWVDFNEVKGMFNMTWNKLRKDLLSYKVGDPEFLNNLIANQRFYGYTLTYEDKYRGSKETRISPPISVDTLIEILGPNMEKHDLFLTSLSELSNDLVNSANPDKRVVFESLRTLHDKSESNSWYREIQENFIGNAYKEIEFRIQENEAARINERKEKFMKLGPDMPVQLAEAMATEKIPQSQAAQIFREGWHRDDLTFEIMTLCLNGDLSFENASWMQKNSNHERLISGILSGKMDLDLAKHLFTLGFGEHPDATGAILDGNEIELVAEMYGISLPSVEETIVEEPEIVNEPKANAEGNNEWGGRFDVD